MIPRFILTAGGLGRLRPAPGTWGSLPPVVLTLVLVWLLSRDGDLDAIDHRTVNAVLILMCIFFSWACIHWGAWAEMMTGRTDPPEVVADEVAGQSIALLAMPWVGITGMEGADPGALLLCNLSMAGMAFLAFRLLDIIKPPPIGALQRFSSGWGILADDLAAGAVALLIVQVLARGVIPAFLH